MQEPISLSTHQDLHDLPAAAFTSIALRERLNNVHRVTFPTGPLTLDQLLPLGDLELAESAGGHVYALLRIEPRVVVHVTAGRGQGAVAVAGDEHESVERVADAFAGALQDDEGGQDRTAVTFWAASPGGVSSVRRRLHAPRWKEVRANYAAPVRWMLGRLMAATSPGPGRLLLFHGEPGTGKSFALRALAREWESWCDAHFITDPDALLGSRVSYLLNTLLREPRRTDGTVPWRLLILEDAGELLAADARAVVGQALSRLLNVTDGLLGDGLRTVVVVTTNEPLRRLHDAVIRPGRCWAQVEFAPLVPAEADAWLASHGAEPTERAMTLAELFATAAGRAVPTRPGMGFRRAC